MMNYDFEKIVNKNVIRNNLDIILSDAEMDYSTAPVICQAIEEFSKKGFFGYTHVDNDYRQAIIDWMKQVRKLDILSEDIVPTHGTIFGLDTAIRAFSQEGDGVIVQHPSFHHYDDDIQRNHRIVMSNRLIEKQGVYTVDFKDLEEKMADPRNKLFVLCHPHNPTGKVFQREELEKIAYLAQKYNVIVFSDEIFGELTFQNHQAISYLSIDPLCGIVATSLGKSFSLTGVNHANILIKNQDIRERYIQQRDKEHFGSIDPFFYVALTSAYSQAGYQWLKAMKKYTWNNYILIQKYLAKELPELILSPLEGGFVIWINFKNWQMSDEELQNFLENELRIIGAPGTVYKQSQCYRFNIATPRYRIEDFLQRLKNKKLVLF